MVAVVAHLGCAAVRGFLAPGIGAVTSEVTGLVAVVARRVHRLARLRAVAGEVAHLTTVAARHCLSKANDSCEGHKNRKRFSLPGTTDLYQFTARVHGTSFCFKPFGTSSQKSTNPAPRSESKKAQPRLCTPAIQVKPTHAHTLRHRETNKENKRGASSKKQWKVAVLRMRPVGFGLVTKMMMHQGKF